MTTFSIINKLKLEGAHRIDAEFYCANAGFVKKFKHGDVAAKVLEYGTSRELNEEKRGFPVLRLNEFEGFFISSPEKYCDKLSKEVFEQLTLKRNDVLVCRTNGNPQLVGKAAVVMEDTKFAFASYLFRIRTNEDFITPKSLVTFLNSRFGRGQIEKFLMPSIQSNFSPTQFRQIKIPVLNREFQKQIDSLIDDAYLEQRRSKQLFKEAESLLLEELGLKENVIHDDLSYVVKLSDVKQAHRLDAEYFQPRYGKLRELIGKQEHESLSKVANIIPADFIPKVDETYKYVELADINSSIGVIDGYSVMLGKEVPSRARRKLQKKDVVVSSVEGSLEKAALVSEDQKDFLASTGFFQFRAKATTPEALLVLAKSPVLQMQLKQRTTGTILTAVSESALEDVVVPVISRQLTDKITELVRQSHEARKKSKELLEEAKRKVEEMIERQAT